MLGILGSATANTGMPQRLKVKASNVDCRLGDTMTEYLDNDVGGELSVLYQIQHP